MSDIADKAQEAEENFFNEAIQKRRAAGPAPCGYCHSCGEKVRGNERWCDVECRNDWEEDQKHGGK